MLERLPVLSKSEVEPSGEPKSEDRAGVGEPSKEMRIASSALAMKPKGNATNESCFNRYPHGPAFFVSE